MRRAHQDMGWLTMPKDKSTKDASATSAAPEQVYGFSLGYDFCAEHEFGARAIRKELGLADIKLPIGVEQRTMTQVPEYLRLVTYRQRPKDKRFKKTMPAALLVLRDGWRAEQDKELTTAKLIESCDVSFWTNFTDNHYEPIRDDIVTAWSSNDGLAIHVRGEENVKRLQELHQAMFECKVALADPSGMGFMRKSLSLVMVDKLPQETLDAVREKDLAHQRLLQAVTDSGIEAHLKAAGKSWYALSPSWEYEEGSELIFFLNPCEQKKYAHGWYNLEDLRNWTLDKGPIVDGNEVEKKFEEIDKNWGFLLLTGFNDKGIKIRNMGKHIWLDEAKTQPGMRILVHRNSEGLLKSGDYSVQDLMPYYMAGQQAYEAKKAAREAEKEKTQAQAA